MKTTLFCILLLLSGIVSAQTIDHPPFKARSGSISNITCIERTPENTRVYIHAIFRPHWWIMEDGDTYLEDAATGKNICSKVLKASNLKRSLYAGFRNDGLCAGFRAVTVRNTDHSFSQSY